MCRVDDDFDLIVYAIAALAFAPEMRVLLFKLMQRNVRQIRLDSAMNVSIICPSKSLTILSSKSQENLPAREGRRWSGTFELAILSVHAVRILWGSMRRKKVCSIG